MNTEPSANLPNPDFVERFRERYPLLAMLIEGETDGLRIILLLSENRKIV